MAASMSTRIVIHVESGRTPTRHAPHHRPHDRRRRALPARVHVPSDGVRPPPHHLPSFLALLLCSPSPINHARWTYTRWLTNQHNIKSERPLLHLQIPIRLRHTGGQDRGAERRGQRVDGDPAHAYERGDR